MLDDPNAVAGAVSDSPDGSSPSGPPAGATVAPPPTPAVSSSGQPPAAGPGADALPPSRTGGVHSVLGSMLFGAIAGAAHATAKAGGAIKQAGRNLAANSPTGQQLQKNALAQKEGQQAMQLNQNKDQREQTAAVDAHTAAKMKNNMDFLDQAAKVETNRHLSEMNPMLEEEARNTIIGQQQTKNKADRKILSDLAAIGVPIDTTHGAGYDGLTGSHASDIAHNVQSGRSNGEEGDKAGFAFIDNRQLSTTPLPHDLSIPTDWKIDPKTGTITPINQTLRAGQNTAMDAIVAHDAGIKKFDELQKNYTQQLANKKGIEENAKLGAETNKANAEAAKAKADTDSLKNLGVVVPPGFTPPANVFTMKPQELHQQLEQNGIKVPNNYASLYGAAHYKVNPNTFPSRPYNRPGAPPQMGKDQAASFIRTFINPNWDENNYAAVHKMEDEFASTRQNTAGGNLIAFNTATGHLGQLYNAATALKNGNVPLLNQLAQEIGVQTGKSAPVVYNGIRTALVGELGKTFKGAAPDVPEMDEITTTLNNAQSPQQAADLAKTYAHLMLTKAGSQVAHYYSYTGELPPQTIDPNAAKVYAAMGINPQEVLPAGASTPVGQTGNSGGQPAQQTQPQGRPVTVNGQVVGHTLDGKTMIPLAPTQ